MPTIDDLRHRLKRLEKDILEAEVRLPAHSIQPRHMAPLLALEDEREAVMSAIQTLEKQVKSAGQ
jgi:hypothetical protein